MLKPGTHIEADDPNARVIFEGVGGAFLGIEFSFSDSLPADFTFTAPFTPQDPAVFNHMTDSGGWCRRYYLQLAGRQWQRPHPRTGLADVAIARWPVRPPSKPPKIDQGIICLPWACTVRKYSSSKSSSCPDAPSVA